MNTTACLFSGLVSEFQWTSVLNAAGGVILIKHCDVHHPLQIRKHTMTLNWCSWSDLDSTGFRLSTNKILSDADNQTAVVRVSRGWSNFLCGRVFY